ncbi:MD-2-related lipid-recognition protein-like [Drosophila sulfurigaster albostrigata]|uniref:MD-2-related lipid-recognition protein-like n=1 Tax=Drosophila sulfurigaster albostrigata TaxID=89887 RepID=UPI002D21E1BE|nr:MD-2-related lipid-recognition protein-like [Drosophila sulfurigaster albostrigata]
MLYQTSLLLLLLAAFASAEIVNFQNCPDSVDVCPINQVRVDPCPQAATRAACHIRRRRPTTMSFDFTPSFDAEKLEASLGWAKSETEELPLISMERDACKSTTCPVQAGKQQTYSLVVPIESKFPISPYTIRWALKDPVSGKRCCFTVDIKVTR